MKSRNLFIVLLFMCCTDNLVYSQINTKNIPFYIDSKLVSCFIDRLQPKGIDTFFCFLTERDHREITYFWGTNGIVYKITDFVIYKSFINGKPANMWKAIVNPSIEPNNKLKFIPPLEASKDCDVLIIYTTKHSYIVQSGNNCFQGILNGKAKKKQSELIKSLEDALMQIPSWNYYSYYKRR